MKHNVILIMAGILVVFSACGKTENETVIQSADVSISIESAETEFVPVPSEQTVSVSIPEEAEAEPENEEIAVTETPPENELFSEIQGDYTYAIGVGFWVSMLTVNADGSFTGEFSDFNGESGYCYSKYSGYFYDVAKVDEFTYTMKRSDLIYEKPIGTEWDDDICHYVFTEALGMDPGTEFVVYKPGKPMAELDDIYRTWIENTRNPRGYREKLDSYAICNTEAKSIFQGNFVSETETENALADTESGPIENVFPDENAIEISDFFIGYKILVPMLDMEDTETWQMSDDSYVKNGFYLEYNTEYGLCSMRNDGNLSVMLYGCVPGNDVDTFENALSENGWKMHGNTNFGIRYAKRNEEGRIYILDLNFGNNRIVTSWYWNNWPEGDFDFSDI